MSYLLETSCGACVSDLKMPHASGHSLLSKGVTQKHSKEELEQRKPIYKLSSLKARAGLIYLRHAKLKAMVCPPHAPASFGLLFI